MLRAAKVAAASQFDPNAEIPDDPDPTAPRQPGIIDKAVDISKKVAPVIQKGLTKTLPEPIPSKPKFVSSRQAPKMRTKPVTKYK